MKTDASFLAQIDLIRAEGQLQAATTTSVGGTAAKLVVVTKALDLNLKPGEVIKLDGKLRAS